MTDDDTCKKLKILVLKIAGDPTNPNRALALEAARSLRSWERELRHEPPKITHTPTPTEKLIGLVEQVLF